MASEAVELARALTGLQLPVTATDVAGVVNELEALGWDREQVRDLRRHRMAEREPWPFPVPVEAQREFGFARFAARLSELRDAMDLSGRVDSTPPSPRALDRDEQRLAADRPPHWG